MTNCKTQPSNKAMVFLEHVMISASGALAFVCVRRSGYNELANPRKGTQHGDADEDVGNDAAGDYSRVLDGSISNNVHDHVQ